MGKSNMRVHTLIDGARDTREGTFEMRDVEVTENGFTAQLRTTPANVSQNGRLGAVRR